MECRLVNRAEEGGYGRLRSDVMKASTKQEVHFRGRSKKSTLKEIVWFTVTLTGDFSACGSLFRDPSSNLKGLLNTIINHNQRHFFERAPARMESDHSL
jgi:hypothetical protein